MNESMIESLLRRAAEIGSAARDEAARLSSSQKDAADAVATARGRESELEALASGFDAPRFVGLTEVAREWARHFNDPHSTDAVTASEAAARAFIATYTAQTEKSARGGKKAGYARVIRLGIRAEAALAALAQRVAHWKRVHDSPVKGESATEARDRKALAKRYYVVNSSSPTLTATGEWPTDSDGAPVRPKYNGRPARTVRGVEISHCCATNRDSQLASFAELFERYGDVVLNDDVVDAFLDNGGRYVHDGEPTLASLCESACDLIDKLLAQGGSASGDAAFLMALHATIKRIATEGFKSPQGANAPASEAPASDVPDVILDAVLGTEEPAAGAVPAQRPRKGRKVTA